MSTPLERDVAAVAASGDLDRLDEMNARQLADVLDRADASGHVSPSQRPPGVPPHDPEAYTAHRRAIERDRKERLHERSERLTATFRPA